MPDVLADEIRAVLDTMGDPERAPEQQRYMKSTMPYRGIVMAELRSTVRAVTSSKSFSGRFVHIVLCKLRKSLPWFCNFYL